MAFKTVGQLRDSISGMLTGLNLNNVVNLYGAIERTARKLVQTVYVPEATGRESITLYNGVFDYTAPTSIFGTVLVDLRPQGQTRSVTDVVYKKPIEVFDRAKGTLTNGYLVAFEYKDGVGRMRVDNTLAPSRIVLDTLSDSTKWTLAGTGTASFTDESNYYWTPASIRFNQTTGIATLTRTLDSTLDLTDYETVGKVFLAVNMPTALTSITVRIGSSATNYVEASATQGFLGAWTTNLWQLTAFDLASATETGTVDWTKIKYVQIRITTGANMNNIRVGGIWTSLPSPHEVIYTTSAIFSAGGVVSSNITDDNDSILLQDNAYTLLEYMSSITIASQHGGSASSPLILDLKRDLYGTGGNDLGLLGQYRAENPSEKLMTVNNWYD